MAERTVDLAAANDALRGQIAERRALERRLEHQATHDPLTDLPNRTSFYENLGRALARARRRGSKVALLFVDLDDFKGINDSVGHQAGDRILREVAARLKGCLHEADTVARLGGDEFAILMEDVAGAGQTVSLAERCAERMGATIELDGKRLSITASIGIAIGVGADPEGLVRAADLAMYRAKNNGEAYSVMSEPGARSTGVIAPALWEPGPQPEHRVLLGCPRQKVARRFGLLPSICELPRERRLSAHLKQSNQTLVEPFFSPRVAIPAIRGSGPNVRTISYSLAAAHHRTCRLAIVRFSRPEGG